MFNIYKMKSNVKSKVEISIKSGAKLIIVASLIRPYTSSSWSNETFRPLRV